MNNLYGQLSPGTGEPANHYYALFEQATDAIMVTDFEGNFKDVNPGLCSIFGYSREELLQMNFCSIMDKQHLAQNPIRFDLLAAGETVLSERKLTTRYGTVIYVECNAKKIAENRILSIARDITLRKKIEQELQEQEANLQTIFEPTDTIYVLMNTELEIVSYNSKAIDFARKELGHDIKISNFFPDYFPRERRNTLAMHTSHALEGRRVKYETKYLQADGSDNWYDVRFFPVVKNETIYGVILSVVDVSEKKRLQKKLLEHTIEEQKSITRAVLKAQEVERNKIGQELHDNVNQILSTIRLHIGMIGRDHNVKKEQLDTVKGYVDLAINEIRALSREQVTPLRKFNLKELIDSLCSRLNEDSGVHTVFHHNVEELLHIEEDLKLNIYRIVQEQTNNILKYAGATRATISIHEQNNLVHVLIMDNGKGFDPMVKRKGIGISNMTNRIESYNGEINIESSPGNGCKMVMTIPVQAN